MTRTTQLIRALRPRRGGRLPLVLLVVVCTVAVTAAVSDAGAVPPGLRFAQFGHWTANPSEGKVFHVNGASRTIDAEAQVEGMDAGSQVVQGPTSGYVVSKDKILEFGKSSLTVEQSMTPPTGEQPVAVEAKGGPYLIYREAGTVVRLGGGEPATIQAGRGLGQPVVTPEGALWVQRTDTNVLCLLTAGTDRFSCPATAPRGHIGALSVAGKQPVFVDTDNDTMTAVNVDGLGRPVKVDVDLPPNAKIASADVGGRIAVIAPSARKLHLLDGSGVGNGRSGPSVTRDLPPGEWAPPAASRSSVVLLDLQGNTVRTFDRDGRPQRVTAIPPEAGEARLSRGEDQRVYVDGGEGKHVLAVGDDGSAGTIPLVGADRSGAPQRPVPPSAEQPVTPPAGPAGGGPQTSTTRPRTPTPGPPGPGAPRAQGEQSGTTRERTSPPATQPTTAPVVPRKTVAPPSPPGMPPGLSASVRGANIRVTWRAAKANGAAVTGYRVTWTPASGGGAGSDDLSGSSRSKTITGPTRGVAYKITVSAQNPAGRGSAATTRITVPRPQRTVKVSRGASTTHEPDCHPPECAFTRVELRGFTPNTSYKINPWSSGWDRWNVGAELSTDSSGTLIVTDRFAFNGVGQTAWVVITRGDLTRDVESNHYLWRSE